MMRAGPTRSYARPKQPRRHNISVIEQPVEVDGEKLMQFVFHAVDEVGATLNSALVVMAGVPIATAVG